MSKKHYYLIPYCILSSLASLIYFFYDYFFPSGITNTNLDGTYSDIDIVTQNENGLYLIAFLGVISFLTGLLIYFRKYANISREETIALAIGMLINLIPTLYAPVLIQVWMFGSI